MPASALSAAAATAARWTVAPAASAAASKRSSAAAPAETATLSSSPSSSSSSPAVGGTPIATTLVRLAALAALASALVCKSSCDAAVAHLWTYLRQNALFKNDSFEPMLATLSFFPWLVMWYAVDMHMPSARRFRIQPNNTSMHQWEWNSPLSHRSVVPTLVFYIVPIMVFDYFFPRRQLPLEAPTALGLLGEVVALLAVYDVLFFAGHFAMHKIPFLYRTVHKKHHKNSATRANDAVLLTLGEEIVDVGCSIAAVNLLGAHPMARALYNMVIVYLLVELHCGYNMPWMVHNVVPFGLMGGPVRHDTHHRLGKVYFQKFFTYIDNALGYVEAEADRKSD